ncbi:hypothetical protein [Streptomyces sp. NPDC058382]|uniref:hypothetical protein n=1 Tax=unclassified Streptomyces TaxID=2593676 RepID=UPI00362F9A09
MPPTASRVVHAALLRRALAPSCLIPGLTPALGSAPAHAAVPSVRDTYRDARDPEYATGDRVPVRAADEGGTIALLLPDNDVMGWASVDGGQSGDEVWHDRSFDGGVSWTGGSKLGDTRTPSGPTGRRTLARYGPRRTGVYKGTGNGCRHSALDLLDAAQAH